MKIKYLLGLLPFVMASSAQAHAVQDQLQACHDAAWSQTEFESLPNAAVSVFLSSTGDNQVVAYWIIDWDDTKAAGKCVVTNGDTDALVLTRFAG